MRWLLVLALCACDDPAHPSVDAQAPDGAPRDMIAGDARTADGAPPDAGPPDALTADGGPADARVDAAPIDEWPVRVLLDGQPAPGVRVMQGGRDDFVLTGPDGMALIRLDRSVPGVPVVVASHPAARIRGLTLWPEEVPPATIELATFSTADNPAYVFQDPGEPRHSDSTSQCGHCHHTLHTGWYDSNHRTAARNERVHDLYAGTGSGHRDEASCVAAGGRWAEGVYPGGERGMRCEVGDSLLGTVPAGDFGHCADCHAPGLDGQLGGRDLQEAAGRAFEYGIHCDVCHRVAEVDLENPGPGVAGKLKLLRPVEEGPITLGAGGRLPLTFGPSHDSPNPRMGSVQRDHFRDGRLCGGCHQYEAPAQVPGQQLDPTRWPRGVMPVMTTWAEWQGSVLSEATACNDCHMPPVPDVSNGADLQSFPLADIGIQGGFIRPAGAVRAHTWPGPRQPASGMLALAGALFVEKQVLDGEVVARVTLKNVGAGHGLPTGEPLRSVLVVVEARCGDTPLAPSGGDALPAWAGALGMKAAGEDWTRWPGAVVGQVVRVMRRTGNFHDYEGFGRFGEGTPERKGLPVEAVLGQATITAVEGDTVTLDRPLPEGDVAFLGDPTWLAGAPGFAYARVMVDAAGREMVPHFRAIDVRSDNRLLPHQRFTSTHRFRTQCPDPQVTARAIHRPFPRWLVAERGWPLGDQVMTEVRR